MADQSNALMVVGAVQGEITATREYRKGNWTLNETLVLIKAKKMDEERRMKREISTGGDQGRGSSTRPTELRWKWVEDYCWKNGCMRSQNQCNDKWDNLMRDYKKVRDHEKKLEDGSRDHHDRHQKNYSYWNLERHERKDKNLPTNLLPQIYEALVEVVERRGGTDHHHRSRAHVANLNPVMGYNLPVDKLPLTSSSVPTTSQLPLLQHPTSLATPPHPPTSLHVQPLPSLDSDASEHSNSAAKRRRRRGGEGSSSRNCSGGGGGAAAAQELGSAISKSASIVSKALLACEEKEERRHRELIDVEERKLKIEESKADINRQAINGLTAAVNNLATSILALASSQRINPSVSK